MYDKASPIPRWSFSTMQRVAAESTIAGAAIRFVNLGVPVFPCVPGDQQPLTPNGFHDATSSARDIRNWWRRTPDANIGLPTGASTGVVVVDIDVHAGGSGFAAFERARSEGLADNWCWVVRTPSGGIHAYYPNARGQEQRSWQVPSAHVDFRGDGGYVIAPPSRIVVDGVMKTYEVAAIATLPIKSVDAIKLRQFLEPPRPKTASPLPDLPPKGCHPEALARTVALTPEGGRNRALFWASCRMAEDGQSRASALSFLMPAAQHAGLCDREIESTIDSAFWIACRIGPRRGLGPAKTARAPSRGRRDGDT